MKCDIALQGYVTTHIAKANPTNFVSADLKPEEIFPRWDHVQTHSDRLGTVSCLHSGPS